MTVQDLFHPSLFRVVKHPESRGPEEHPEGYLLGRVDIGPVSFHVELIEVQEIDDEQVAVLPPEFHAYSELSNAIGNDGPFETLNVEGRKYVMFIYPFS